MRFVTIPFRFAVSVLCSQCSGNWNSSTGDWTDHSTHDLYFRVVLSQPDGTCATLHIVDLVGFQPPSPIPKAASPFLRRTGKASEVFTEVRAT